MEIVWAPQPAIEAIRRGTLRGVVMATNRVRNEILERILSGSKSGRVYQRRGVTHQASAPGEAPASDQGELVRGITTTVQETPEGILGRVNSGAAHSFWLEIGTPTIEPRPHMRASLEATRGEVQEIIAREIRLELGKG